MLDPWAGLSAGPEESLLNPTPFDNLDSESPGNNNPFADFDSDIQGER